mmetsp:Transcript_71858/g.150136  ORF Transcript_71858/g.150136 Transcript_71858/m.150136 type:complete len:154 (+) Transcript_71858:1-462(+)
MPAQVTKVLRSSSVSDGAGNVRADSVLAELRAHGVQEVQSQTFKHEGESSEEVFSWIQAAAADAPVVILHHESPAPLTTTMTSTTRRILSTGDNSTVPELTEFEISQYQICMWTGIGFVLLLLVSVCSIAQMEVIPDSILYAKFQSGRTGKSD